jgi:hypothetical protein
MAALAAYHARRDARVRCVQVAEVEGGAAAWALDGRVLVDDVAVQARHSSGRCDDRFGLRGASLSV